MLNSDWSRYSDWHLVCYFCVRQVGTGTEMDRQEQIKTASRTPGTVWDVQWTLFGLCNALQHSSVWYFKSYTMCNHGQKLQSQKCPPLFWLRVRMGYFSIVLLNKDFLKTTSLNLCRWCFQCFITKKKTVADWLSNEGKITCTQINIYNW